MNREGYDRLVERNEELKRRLTVCRQANQGLADDARKLGDDARENQRELERVRRLVREAQTEAHQANTMNARLLGLVEKLTTQTSPELILETVMTGIKEIVTPTVTYQEDPRVKETEMGAQGLGDNAGVEPGKWFPEVEFDEHMETERAWPTPGNISSPNNETGFNMEKAMYNTDGPAPPPGETTRLPGGEHATR